MGLKSFLFYSPLDHMTTESRQRWFISARRGGTTYNPTFRMCCGGTIQVRSGIRPACCGTRAYDANFRICCGGTVQFRSGITPACCGTQAYNANFRICCGGIVKFRCWPVSSENSIVMMMIKLKIKIKTIKIIIAKRTITKNRFVSVRSHETPAQSQTNIATKTKQMYEREPRLWS